MAPLAARLAGEHQALIDELQAKRPHSRELNWPFYSPLRPSTREEATPAQQEAIEWRDHFRPVMLDLEEYLESDEQLSPDTLWRRYTLLGDLSGVDAEHILKNLEKQKQHLSLVHQSATSAVPSSPAEAPQKAVEAIHRDWFQDNRPEKLRAARNHLGDSQKAAAHKCGGAKLETYKKWEQGRRPDKKSISAILVYCTGATQQISV